MQHPRILCVIVVGCILTLVSSWSVVSHSIGRFSLHGPHFRRDVFRKAQVNGDAEETTSGIVLEAVAASGLEEREVVLIQGAIQDALVNVGLEQVVLTNATTWIKSWTETCSATLVKGALGRVFLLQTNLDEESIEVLRFAIAEQMDHLLYSSSETQAPALCQPALISVRNSILEPLPAEVDVPSLLGSVVEHEVEEYEMTKPVAAVSDHQERSERDSSFVPPLHIELDAAQTIDAYSSTTWWDTSSVVVWDDLVDDDLRRRLLDVTLGRRGDRDKVETAEDDCVDDWDDVADGPDPKRWMRGGLLDIPQDDEEDRDEATDDSTEDHKESGPCWGLRDEAIEDLCSGDHQAIEEFEQILANLFPQFVVTRLPEAVFGSCVSPLTANAPTAGDCFNYHIDGDPNLAPPSPWTDVFGRYPNRLNGKPRFMSCLVYLNDEWDKDWGAPTRFLDIPTGDSYEVLPRPGRCVLMDQDCSHTVVAPNLTAGKRPRYSLVWKLVLHPKVQGQDMTDLACDMEWPDPLLFGSANVLQAT